MTNQYEGNQYDETGAIIPRNEREAEFLKARELGFDPIPYEEIAKDDEVSYIVRGPFCWGRGNTPEAALRNCRKEWSVTYAGKYTKRKTDCHRVVGDWSISDFDGAINAREIENVWRQEIDARERPVPERA